MGVGLSGLISNLPGTVTPYPTQDPSLELGGYRSAPNAAARDAIPANFRAVGMAVTLQDTGVTYKLVGGTANANWLPTQDAAIAYIIRADLAALTAQDNPNFPNGCQAYVVAEREIYQLDTLDALTTFSPLIVARGAGGAGKWYRRSRAHVVGNYTLWCQSWAIGFCGYTPGQLLASGNTEPDILITIPGGIPGPGTQQLITDAVGNLWLSTTTNTTVSARKWRLSDCLRSGSPPPVLTMSAAHIGGGSQVSNIIFDRQSGLWLAVGENASFGRFAAVRFGPRAQAPDGTRTLTLQQTAAPDPNYGFIGDWVFDGEGNLWVNNSFAANSNLTGAVIMFSAQQLIAGGAVVPAVVWTGSNFTSTATGGQGFGMALSANGLLWTLDGEAKILKAWPFVGAVSGNPAPTITITSTSPSFALPYSLAFDASGNLWVNNGAANGLMRFPAASLTSSGSKTPDVVITPLAATLTSTIVFPNNPDRCGLLPAGFP